MNRIMREMEPEVFKYNWVVLFADLRRGSVTQWEDRKKDVQFENLVSFL